MPEQILTSNTETTSVSEAPQPPQQSRLKPPKTKRRRVWIWVLAVLFAGIVALIVWRHYQAAEQAKKAKAATPSAVPIETSTARKGDIGVYVEALGTVTPVYTVTVTSRVQGQIMNVFYREGQMVHKGDPLLDIDARPYQAALTQVQGQLVHDQAALSEAQIDLDRYRAALARNAIAQQQVYDQEQTVHQDEGTVKNDEGQVQNAEVNLVYTHITSSIDGRVGLRLVDPGNIVQANSTTSLVVITQLQPITVIFSVAEDYLPQIQKQLQQGHTMAVDALDRTQSTELAKGSVLTLDNQVDTTTGTVKVRAIFPNKNSALFPNQFVNARLLVDTQHNVILIPTPAIQRNSQNTFVYVIKSDQTASMRTVKVGTTDGNTTAVQGVQSGEVVAVDGFDKLQDSVKVTGKTQNQEGGNSGQSNEDNSSNGDQAP